MTLSVIIVNYNVKDFLEQCLQSVQKAIAGINAEIWVIDNHSTDGSVAYLKQLPHPVHGIFNEYNTGFSKACNQGFAKASGEFILFLNPDTIVPEDCFRKCLSAMEGNSSIGALGVKMVNGDGEFLKESKRSLPTPVNSLYKLFGLSDLFPRSRIFSAYHLGHLDENKDHEIDVLCGAFMMVRKKVLDQIGGFDESFFMYGEDVDLSYRIRQAGYKNYYLSQTSIIHYKGESTNKNSFRYVQLFYGAMMIFVDKYYKGLRKSIFKLFIYCGIGIRAMLSLIKMPVKKG